MDANTLQAVQIVTTGIGTAFIAWIAFKTNQIGKDTDETRKLVNHQFQVQLELYAHSTRVNADLLKTPGAEALAVAAKKKYDDHVKAQRKIDAKK